MPPLNLLHQLDPFTDPLPDLQQVGAVLLWLQGLELLKFKALEPTFPRSAAWVRRNPVRVLPI